MAGSCSCSWRDWRGCLEKVLRDRDRIWTKPLEKLETKIGVDRVNIVLVLKVFLVIYLIVGRGREFICNLIGFVYPAYASIKAIESKEKDDDTQWLTYWVVYATFSLIEFFSDYFLSWMPFYWLLKCLFLVVCMLPFKWNGSTFIYKRVIRPCFLRHEKKLDEAVDSAAAAGESLVEEATGRKRWFGGRRGSEEGDGGAKDTAAAEETPSSSTTEDVRRRRIFGGEDDEQYTE